MDIKQSQYLHMSTQVGFISSENRLNDLSGAAYEIKLKDRSEGGLSRGCRIEFVF